MTRTIVAFLFLALIAGLVGTAPAFASALPDPAGRQGGGQVPEGHHQGRGDVRGEDAEEPRKVLRRALQVHPDEAGRPEVPGQGPGQVRQGDRHDPPEAACQAGFLHSQEVRQRPPPRPSGPYFFRSMCRLPHALRSTSSPSSRLP